MLWGGCGISGVINFRLEQVIIPRRISAFRSSSLSRMYADYYFCVDGLFDCVGVDAQLFYSVINKGWAGCLVVVVASGRSVTTISSGCWKKRIGVFQKLLTSA